MAVTARGLIGTGSATTAGTTITVTNTTGAIIPAGTFIHITGCWDNINSVTAPTITCSTVGGVAPTANNATAIGSGVTTTAGSGVWHKCFRVLTTGTIASGATIATLTSNQSAVKRAAHAEGFDNCTATLRGTVTTGTSAAGTPSVTTTGTALVIGDLVIGSISLENNAQATADADTTGGAWPPIVGIATSGGGAAANVDSGSQYKILTATGTQTFNPTCPAADAVVCVYSLVPVPEPTFTQAAYRLYADGTETGSTALAAQDTAPEVDVSGGDVNLQLRVRVQSTNAGAVAATDDYQLQYAKNGGAYADVSAGATVLADSYAETNQDGDADFGTLATAKRGQSFIGNGQKLSQCGFWLKKFAATTGTLTAELYAHTGTFGSGATPTGSRLALSTTSIAASSLATTYAWQYFDFTPTYTVTNGTPYFITISSTATDSVSSAVTAGSDISSPAHAGNGTTYSGTWTAISADHIFRVYTTVVATTVIPYTSADLTDGAATTNRLGAGTGSFVAGEISEDGLVDDYAPTVNNYTELLYSITLKRADLTDGDTLTFRVVRNGLTTGFTYTATPTVTIQVGAANISGTAAISASVATTAVGVPTTFGTAALTESAAVTVTATPTTFGTAAIAAAATVTAAGTVSAGGANIPGTAAISTGAAITAAGVPTTFGTAATTMSAAITAVGTPTTFGTATLTGTATVTAAGAPTRSGTATLAAAAAITATGTRTSRGTATLATTATITAVGSSGAAPEVTGTATVWVTHAITAHGTRTLRGTATVAVEATITGTGSRAATGTATVVAAATITAAGTVTAPLGPGVGTALLVASATITAAGTRTVFGARPTRGTSFTITASSTLELGGYRATFDVVMAAAVDHDYRGGWDVDMTQTVDHQYTHTLELV